MSLSRYFWISTILIASAVLPRAMAQTAGATAPEVTQFEPVDITDLVNLATGDFTYALPVMTIPGAPGGGYPLSLNYVAGIKHGQEASWVGLGWNLSPGSVARAVRAHPDDFRGATVFSKETLPSVHGYHVGLGYAGWSASVRWDNHGGLGGSVGLSYANANSNFNYYRSADNQSSTSVGISTSVSSQITAGAHYGSQGFSATASVSAGNAASLSLSSAGNVGFSFAGGSHSLSKSPAYSPFVTRTGEANVNILFVSLGFSKSYSYRKQYSDAYGYLHLPRQDHPFRDEIPESPAAYPDVAGGSNVTGLDRLDAAGVASLQAEVDALDVDRTYYRNYHHRAVLLDGYFQDFNNAYAGSADQYQFDAFDTNYANANFDIYNVAAQGISGVAKPVLSKRGLLVPQDQTSQVSVDGSDWRFFPYRNLVMLLNGEPDPDDPQPTEPRRFPVDITRYFQDIQWRSELADNMVFLSDPGLSEDYRPFSPADESPLAYRRHQYSQRIRYVLDHWGKIGRIEVTNPNGVKYIFGVMANERGHVTAGARPHNYGEQSHFRVTSEPGAADPDSIKSTYVAEPYAYAWYLAAVVSPDYYDAAPCGHIGPEDYGDYVTFHYQLANPSMQWMMPLSGGGVDGDGEPDFLFLGKSIYEDKYHYERRRGVKELYFPTYARTRTHFAAFDFGFDREDHLTAEVPQGSYLPPETRWDPANVDRNQIVFFPGLHYQPAADPMYDRPQNAPTDIHQDLLDLYAQENLSAGDGDIQRHFLLLMPRGTARRLDLDMGQSIQAVFRGSFAQVNPTQSLDQFEAPFEYLGTWREGDHDLFHVEAPLSDAWLTRIFDGSIFSSIHVDLNRANEGNPPDYLLGPNGSVYLKSIRLFDLEDVPAILQGNRGALTTITYDINHLLKYPVDQNPEEDAWGDDYQSKVEFQYDYLDYPHMPNSENGRRLFLTKVSFKHPSDVLAGHPYEFEYYADSTSYSNEGYGPSVFKYYHRDPWGYPNLGSTAERSFVAKSLLSDGINPIQASYSLKSVLTPVGTRLSITYDRDRYTYVQDRVALVREDGEGEDKAFGLSGRPGENGEEVSLFKIDHPEPMYHLVRDDQGDVLPFLTLVDDVYQAVSLNWNTSTEVNGQTQTDAYWQEQVVVQARACFGTIPTQNCDETNTPWWCGICDDGNSATSKVRFILPTQQDDPTKLDKTHPATLEFVRWLWYMSQEDAVVDRFSFHGIPKKSGSQPALPDPEYVGEFAGGLRVAELVSQPESYPGATSVPNPVQPPPELVQRVRYSYTDPETGMDSGAIFLDPPLNNSGSGGDRRVLRSEAHPYANMPGSEVTYGWVRVQTVSEGLDTGHTQFQFHTARDAVIHKPFKDVIPSETVTASPMVEETVNTLDSLVELSASDVPLVKWKLKRENNADQPEWEVDYLNNEYPAKFSLEYQSVQRVLNNTSLIGTIKKEEVWDSRQRKIREAMHTYQPSYTPGSDQSYLLKHLSMSPDTGTLTEGTIPGTEDATYPNGRPFTRHWYQGVSFERNMMIAVAPSDLDGIGNEEGNGREYRVGFRMQDEIFNTFRRVKTTTRSFSPLHDRTIEEVSHQEVLAFDAGTGGIALSQTQTMDGDGSIEYRYDLQVPAYRIFTEPFGNPPGSQCQVDGQEWRLSMLDQNMRAQPGLAVAALRTMPLTQPNLENGLLGALTADGTHILGARLDHWSQKRLAGRDTAWAQDASFAFVHPDAAKTGNGWLQLKVPSIGGNLLNLSWDTGSGRWEAPGQNLQYNHQGNVVEYRDRQDRFSAAVYDQEGIRLKASFSNAQLGQVYYQGFEDLDAGADPTVYANTAFPTIPANAATYLHQFRHAYVGTQAKSGSFTIPAAFGNAYFPTVRDPRAEYWVSFYVKPNGPGTQITLPGINLGVQPRRPQSSSDDPVWIRAVDNGWYLVRHRTSTLLNYEITVQSDSSSPNGSDTAYFDEITVYPAADAAGEKSDAQVSIIGYDPHRHQVISITDARGRTARFEYNRKGELFRTYDPDGILKSEHYRVEYGELPTP